MSSSITHLPGSRTDRQTCLANMAAILNKHSLEPGYGSMSQPARDLGEFLATIVKGKEEQTDQLPVSIIMFIKTLLEAFAQGIGFDHLYKFMSFQGRGDKKTGTTNDYCDIVPRWEKS